MNGKKILLVEDEEVIRKVFGQIVKGKYHVEYAGNGMEGLEQYDVHRPQLGMIITDMEMPLLGGEEFIKRVRGYGDKIPIVAWSANKDLEDVALEAGAHMFLEKPFPLETLYAAFEHYLEGK